MSYSVGQVAGLAGVTVRTLHHYDEIGLLSPGERSPAGYRRYSESDVDRLQLILLYRELGFSLEEIAAIVDDAADVTAHLKRQRELLVQRINRLRRMVAAVDRTLEAKKMGMSLTPEEKLEVFGGFTPPPGYAEQAAQRWGELPQWATAMGKAGSMTKQDWIAAEQRRKDWVRRFGSIVDSGAPADGAEAMALAEEHRTMLAEFMGECSFELHRRVTELYVTEPAQLEFLVRENERRPGMAEFLRDAARANAERAGG